MIVTQLQGMVHTYSHQEKVGKKTQTYMYEWVNDVPFNGGVNTVRVNYFSLTVTTIQKDGSEAITYRNSWVTDLPISQLNIRMLARLGRSRWKIENECFNTLKNQGYEIEHNYGHGNQHLAFNIYLLILIAFLFHQVAELTDRLYQACRQKFGSKKHLWETLRAYIKILVFETWEMLLEFALDPPKYEIFQSEKMTS